MVCRSYLVFSGNNTQWKEGELVQAVRSIISVKPPSISDVYLWVYALDLPECSAPLYLSAYFLRCWLVSACFDW